MARPWPLGILVACALLLAGCTASGEDPFAYTRKPLYTGGFDLERLDGGTEEQQFRVSDGSISAVRLQVWVNATSGGGSVRISDPSGRLLLATEGVEDRVVPMNLGAWTVHVEGEPGASGHIGILVTRA